MPPVRETARAKVNLDLCIAGRRADGYHELDSVVVFAALADRLTFRPADHLRLEIGGPLGSALTEEPDNLVLRAARLLAARAGYSPAVAITLEKTIPVAAGLGGGSADAAATLRGLTRLWGLDLSPEDLLPLALELGADVPVCLASRPARMRGIGERLEVLAGVPALLLLLVNPGVAVPTAACFAGLRGEALEPCPDGVLEPGDLLAWLRRRANHLEGPARRIAPAIGDVLEVLREQPGCALARVSGSGATCFGIFDDEPALARAEEAVCAHRPGWWVHATRTGAA